MDAIRAALAGHDVRLRDERHPDLAALAGCPQSAAFHAEGDVATHTEWVYELTRQHAGVTGAAGAGLRLAGLLHDVGKPATTVPSDRGGWSAKGHELAGAGLVSTLFATHPALLAAPLGLYPCVHALVRDHMWTYAGDRITSGAALRMTHLTDPALLTALWDADARGRICDDPDDVADRVGYAGLVLHDLDAARPDSHGLLDQVDPDRSADPRARRETFRTLIEGGPTDPGAVAAQLAAASRHGTGGSLTYTIGLPGVGKSSWARQVWQPATDGVVLTSAGARRRDRRAATAAVLQAVPRLLAAGAAVCVDATHLVRESRDVLVTYAGRYGAPLHAVLFRAALATALRRQDTRHPDDAVPRAGIEDLQRRMRWPTPDEYQTLTVVEESGAAWSYTPRSRWLDAAEAVRRFGVRDTPWAR